MIILVLTVTAQDPQIPDGWLSPIGSDYDLPWRAESPSHYYSAAADLDGDEIMDHALILMSEDGMRFGLFIYLSDMSYPEPFVFDAEQDPQNLMFMCIEAVPPGEYLTACGKGYWECGEGESPEIELLNQGIDYYASEGANSFLIWDPGTETMLRIWMSD